MDEEIGRAMVIQRASVFHVKQGTNGIRAENERQDGQRAGLVHFGEQDAGFDALRSDGQCFT